MNYSTEPVGAPDTRPALARRFAMIMDGLRALIALITSLPEVDVELAQARRR